MGKIAQLVMGPAGAGKSTYCNAIVEHCETLGRTVHVVNLDPAAEDFKYPVSLDVRDLVAVDDVMDELKYGPNGGLVFCMEYLVNNLDWLRENIGDYDDDYLIFDCPGQVELYIHLPFMSMIITALQSWGYNVCAVYLMDAQFVCQPEKFVAGTMMCLSCMMQLETPHINVLSKMDLFKAAATKEERRQLRDFLELDMDTLLRSLDSAHPSQKYQRLNRAISEVVSDFNIVSFVPMDIADPESIAEVLYHVDMSVQYGEDLEPKIPNDLEDEDADANFGDLLKTNYQGGGGGGD